MYLFPLLGSLHPSESTQTKDTMF